MFQWGPSSRRNTLKAIGTRPNSGPSDSSAGNSRWYRLIVVGVVAAITAGASFVAEPIAQAENASSEPTAVISVDAPPGTLKVGTSITLDASGSYGFTGDKLAYEWNVYRGQAAVVTNTNKSFTYRFDAPGDYLISLSIIDDKGGVDVATVELYVFDADLQPVASFTIDTDPIVTPGYPVTFDASKSRGATELTYRWSIENVDPGVSPIVIGSAMVQEYRFATPGRYNVKLIVTDRTGATSETSRPMTVASSPDPVATFTQAPSAIVVTPGTTVTFDGRGSTGDQITYAWYVASAPGIVGTEPILDFTFKTAGSIDDRIYVRLDVTDIWGRTASKWTHISVVAPDPPIAAFTQTPSASTVAVGTKVTFDATASTGHNVSYAWYVRGHKGVAGTEPVLEYTFRNGGDYGVEVRITDSTGQSTKKWTGLKVNDTQPPRATFSQSPRASTVARGTAVTFDGSASTGDRVSYAWRVRGAKGIVSDQPVLTHTFGTDGDYGVELTVTDATGRISKKWTGITVRTNRAPVAAFTQSPASLTIRRGTVVTFDGSVSSDPDGDQLKYSWFVRGASGVVSQSAAMTYRFTATGRYGVELRVVDSSGASSKKWIQITVTA